MAVRIRLKKMGRKSRPYYRLCAVDSRAPRDGRVIEELGCYDPMVQETDARVTLKSERVDYWLGVGAQPSQKAGVLIKKYGTDGTHLEQQKAAVERMKSRSPVRSAPVVGTPPPAEAPAAETPATEPSPADDSTPEPPPSDSSES